MSGKLFPSDDHLAEVLRRTMGHVADGNFHDNVIQETEMERGKDKEGKKGGGKERKERK